VVVVYFEALIPASGCEPKIFCLKFWKNFKFVPSMVRIGNIPSSNYLGWIVPLEVVKNFLLHGKKQLMEDSGPLLSKFSKEAFLLSLLDFLSLNTTTFLFMLMTQFLNIRPIRLRFTSVNSARKSLLIFIGKMHSSILIRFFY